MKKIFCFSIKIEQNGSPVCQRTFYYFKYLMFLTLFFLPLFFIFLF